MTENQPEIPAYDLYWKKKLKSLKDISYSSDGTHLLVGSDDGRIYLFNNDGTELWQQNQNNLTCLDISGDSSKIIAGNNSGSLYFFSKEGNCEWEKKLNGSINSLSISDDGKNICAGTDKGIIIDFDGTGIELWKQKIKGASDGGICHSPDGKFIAVGSWDTVHLLHADGKIIWKYKFNKKITDVCVAENVSIVAVSTKGSIAFLGNDGHLISEKHIPNGFICISACENAIYAASSNNVHIFNHKGDSLSSFEVSEDILQISVNSKEFISAVSENRIYMFSSLMKPKVNIVTDSLTIGEKQPLKIEVVNSSPKELEFELELRSKELAAENLKSNVNVPAKGKSSVEFEVKPNKIGKCNVEFFMKNKNIKCDKNILEIMPLKVELNISHNPKYEFNAEDDEITMVVCIENSGRVTAKNIHIAGHDNLFLPDLKPGTKELMSYKIKLPSGNHNLLKNIVYEDEFSNKFSVYCSCSVSVKQAPYVWGIQQPVPKIITGKPATVKFNVKNIKNNILNLIFNITSEKIKIEPPNVQVSLNPSESRDLDFTFTPIEFGENIKLDIAIEYEGKKQCYSNDIKVFPGPPHIHVKNYIPKDKYLLGEEIYETLELLNDGESVARNINLNDKPLDIPLLEPRMQKVIRIPLKNDIIHSFGKEKKSIHYKDEFGDLSTDFISAGYTVHGPILEIKVPEINLNENVDKDVVFEVKNVSNELMKEISFELSIADDNTTPNKYLTTIETISPNATKLAIFRCKAHKEGIIDFNICAKHRSEIIAQKAGTFISGSKMPDLLFKADDSGMVQNAFSQLKLNITNKGEMEAIDIHLKLHCDLAKLSNKVTPNEKPELKEIKPNESKEITFGFDPRNEGKVIFIILSSYKSKYGKVLPEIRSELSVTIRPEAYKPETQNIYYGDVLGTGAKKITDSVSQEKFYGNSSGKVDDSNIQKNNEKYRTLCIQALEDGNITSGERDILDTEAKQLGLTDSEKKNIEDEISKNKGIKTANLEDYRKGAYAVFRKGTIKLDQRRLLDASRINYHLNRELQKQIEDAILTELSKENITVEEEIMCPNCEKIILKGTFCINCGRKSA